MTFGQKVKKLRNDNNLTQEELAEKVLVTRTAISKWETDKGYPTIDSLKLLADLFHTTIDELISDADVSNKRILDDKRAKTFYGIAVAFLSLTLVATLITYFVHVKYLWILSLVGVIGYTTCAIFSKPRYKRLEMKKYIFTYIISRVVVLGIVIGLIVYTIVTMK